MQDIAQIDCMVEKGVILPDAGERLKRILVALPETSNGLLAIIAAVLIDEFENNNIIPSSSSSSSSTSSSSSSSSSS